MGVYLRVGVPLHEVSHETAEMFSSYGSFAAVQRHLVTCDSVFIFLGQGCHKIKKKAEQIACEQALDKLGALANGPLLSESH